MYVTCHSWLRHVAYVRYMATTSMKIGWKVLKAIVLQVPLTLTHLGQRVERTYVKLSCSTFSIAVYSLTQDIHGYPGV